MKQLDFIVLIDDRPAFSTNDICNVLRFYDDVLSGFRRQGIDHVVRVLYKGKPITERQISNISWC